MRLSGFSGGLITRRFIANSHDSAIGATFRAARSCSRVKRTGPQLDTEKLIDVLENTRNFDLGLGANLGFGRAEHQASHKIFA
jgi:hypothetical protein